VTDPATIHLRPETDLAERVLLPGDPARALQIAQSLLERPLMFNHHRGLWGYTGLAPDGEPLTVQSTGMGGPSAAIVLHELIELGVRRAVRVGSCGALAPGLTLGELILAGRAIAADGTSRALGAHEHASADRPLTQALADAAGVRAATVASTDLFYEPDASRESAWRAAGAVAVEMEAAALFTVGARRGVPVACLLAVSDLVGDEHRARIDDESLTRAGQRMGAIAATALASLARR
jgi:DeoD family purine-nucleoside phosphorylase